MILIKKIFIFFSLVLFSCGSIFSVNFKIRQNSTNMSGSTTLDKSCKVDSEKLYAQKDANIAALEFAKQVAAKKAEEEALLQEQKKLKGIKEASNKEIDQYKKINNPLIMRPGLTGLVLLGNVVDDLKHAELKKEEKKEEAKKEIEKKIDIVDSDLDKPLPIRPKLIGLGFLGTVLFGAGKYLFNRLQNYKKETKNKNKIKEFLNSPIGKVDFTAVSLLTYFGYSNIDSIKQYSSSGFSKLVDAIDKSDNYLSKIYENTPNKIYWSAGLFLTGGLAWKFYRYLFSTKKILKVDSVNSEPEKRENIA